MKKEEKEIYKRALAFYGDKAQAGKLVEELAELIVEVQHMLFKRRGVESKLAEEIADVEIMLAQFKIMLPSVAALSRIIKIRKLSDLSKKIPFLTGGEA